MSASSKAGREPKQSQVKCLCPSYYADDYTGDFCPIHGLPEYRAPEYREPARAERRQGEERSK